MRISDWSSDVCSSDLLSIMTYGGTGNVSMYVSLGEEPTPESNDSWSTRRGNSETVRFFAPEAGTYFIKLTGHYSRLTLVARPASSTIGLPITAVPPPRLRPGSFFGFSFVTGGAPFLTAP